MAKCACGHAPHPDGECPEGPPSNCECPTYDEVCPVCEHARSSCDEKGVCQRIILRPHHERYGKPCGCTELPQDGS